MVEAATETGSSMDLWQAYVATRDRGLRERLLLQYTPLVKYVVGRLSINLPAHLEHGDLVSWGILGLIEAVDRFDPARGTQFQAYAVCRIRGAIIDQLRSQGALRRASLRKARLIEETVALLQAELGRAPDEREIAARLGIGLDELQSQLAATAPVVISLECAGSSLEPEGLSLAETIADERCPDPLEHLEHEEAVGALAAAIDELPERERILVGLRYHEGLTVKEISQVLGVSESRVSQLHTQALLRLRARLRNGERGACRVA